MIVHPATNSGLRPQRSANQPAGQTTSIQATMLTAERISEHSIRCLQVALQEQPQIDAARCVGSMVQNHRNHENPEPRVSSGTHPVRSRPLTIAELLPVALLSVNVLSRRLHFSRLMDEEGRDDGQALKRLRSEPGSTRRQTARTSNSPPRP